MRKKIFIQKFHSRPPRFSGDGVSSKYRAAPRGRRALQIFKGIIEDILCDVVTASNHGFRVVEDADPYGGGVAITMCVNGYYVGEAFRLLKSCDLMLYKTGGETPPLRRYNNDLRTNPPLSSRASSRDLGRRCYACRKAPHPPLTRSPFPQGGRLKKASPLGEA